jgi:ATP-dependent DNA helicase RecG
MQAKEIYRIIEKGEGLQIEFKKATHALPNNIFESICAFLNKNGGTILLGVDDEGNILGVLEKHVEALCKNLVNLSNNVTKIAPAFLLQPNIVDVEGKKVIHVFIPSSSQVHKTQGKYYDRSMDGDFLVSSHAKISELYARKNTLYSENTIYPYLNESHFEPETIEKAKRLIRANRPAHPWLELVGIDFFIAAGLFREDLMTHSKGFTMASLLLFGKEEAIQSMLPHYKIDALIRRNDQNRYDHRLTLRCNLIKAYDELMFFVSQNLLDKFQLIGDQRISLRENIFRELIANLLVHREYINPRVSTIEIYSDNCVIKNANKPYLYGAILPEYYESYPKNPNIAKFFVQMARAEDLGTGIRNIFKWSMLYSGNHPKFSDADLFEVLLPLYVEKTTPKTTPKTTLKTTPKTTLKTISKTQDKVMNLLRQNPSISKKEIAALLHISIEGVKYHIKTLKNKEKIKFEGASKNRKWIVLVP